MRKDYKSLGHIFQIYARTWSPRIDRHDALVNEIVTFLKHKKFEVLVEPRRLTPAGVKKPGIVAWLPGYSAVVIDVALWLRCIF